MNYIINLLSHAPKDEYYSEIAEIEKMLNSTTNCAELAMGIYDIFDKYFGNGVFLKTQYECAIVAQKILSYYEDR